MKTLSVKMDETFLISKRLCYHFVAKNINRNLLLWHEDKSGLLFSERKTLAIQLSNESKYFRSTGTFFNNSVIIPELKWPTKPTCWISKYIVLTNKHILLPKMWEACKVPPGKVEKFLQVWTTKGNYGPCAPNQLGYSANSQFPHWTQLPSLLVHKISRLAYA